MTRARKILIYVLVATFGGVCGHVAGLIRPKQDGGQSSAQPQDVDVIIDFMKKVVEAGRSSIAKGKDFKIEQADFSFSGQVSPVDANSKGHIVYKCHGWSNKMKASLIGTLYVLRQQSDVFTFVYRPTPLQMEPLHIAICLDGEKMTEVDW